MSSATTSTPIILDAEQQQVIDELATLQTELGLSDKKFAKDYLQYSDNSWYRIKKNQYQVKDIDNVIISLRSSLKTARKTLAAAAKFRARSFLQLDDFKAVIKAVIDCKAKPLEDPDRIVFYLAPTGGGKSALCAQLVITFGACVIEAREAWKKSYFTALKDICEGVGIDTSEMYTPTEMETALFKQLDKKWHLLAIDEGEYFGAEALNLLKRIVNMTKTTILITCIGAKFDKWNAWYAHEARQIRRRTHVIIRFDGIEPTEAIRFLRCKVVGQDDARNVGELLANAANDFGAYDLLTRISQDLGEESQTISDVSKAISRAEAALGIPQMKTNGKGKSV